MGVGAASGMCLSLLISWVISVMFASVMTGAVDKITESKQYIMQILAPPVAERITPKGHCVFSDNVSHARHIVQSEPIPHGHGWHQHRIQIYTLHSKKNAPSGHFLQTELVRHA